MSIESNLTVIGKRYGCAVEYDATIDSETGRLIEFSAEIAGDYGCSINDDTSFFMVHSLGSSCYAHNTEWKTKVNKVLTVLLIVNIFHSIDFLRFLQII